MAPLQENQAATPHWFYERVEDNAFHLCALSEGGSASLKTMLNQSPEAQHNVGEYRARP
jgi:hypothetical protein